MEEIETYIESGILELYVLGDVTPDERAHVEVMASKHPVVKAELGEIEKSLEAYAEVYAVDPAEKQRDRILNSLLINLGDDRIFESRQARVKDNIIPFERAGSTNFYKYAFAACLALLMVSIAALFSVYNRLQQSNTLLASLQSDNQRFSNRVNLMDHELNVFRDPSFKMMKLQGSSKSPASTLTVAWSPAKKKVMIDMANAKMPANDQDHQYQLWALVAGKPVDLGVFDANTTSKDMKEMKSIALADNFAVTLEPRGGSPSPHLENLVVIGKL